MLAHLSERQRRTIHVRDIMPAHVGVNHRPFIKFGQPHLVDDMTILVVFVLGQTGDIPCLNILRKKQLKRQDAVQTTVEGWCDILCVFPQSDGVDMFWPYLLVVMGDVRGHEFTNGNGFFPCIGIFGE